MTYGELLTKLYELSPSNLAHDVSVYCEVSDEFFAVSDFTFTVGNDVLDDNHPILTIEN
jgi:hypothetical protein